MDWKTIYVAILVIAAAGCPRAPIGDDDEEGPSADCSLDMSGHFNSGSPFEPGPCTEVLLGNLDFEFDPDDPPELQRMEVRLSTAEPGGDFECHLQFELPGMCGGGYHRPAAGEASVELVTHDCPGVDAENEGALQPAAGWIHLAEIDTGTQTGDLGGTPFELSVAGAFSLTAPGARGFVVDGTFSFARSVEGTDAEEGDCLDFDGDRDEDRHLSTAVGGDDCNDSDPSVHPGARESCDGVDSDCDGDVDEGCP